MMLSKSLRSVARRSNSFVYRCLRQDIAGEHDNVCGMKTRFEVDVSFLLPMNIVGDLVTSREAILFLKFCFRESIFL